MLERQLEAYFSAQCKRLGIMNLKLNVTGKRGWPDRLVVLVDGQILWIELKTLTGVLSAWQVRIHKQLRELGHEVLVLRTKEEILKTLENCLHLERM